MSTVHLDSLWAVALCKRVSERFSIDFAGAHEGPSRRSGRVHVRGRRHQNLARQRERRVTRDRAAARAPRARTEFGAWRRDPGLHDKAAAAAPILLLMLVHSFCFHPCEVASFSFRGPAFTEYM